ncbi:ribonuclease Z [Candidatus Woesearchaeota archaeon]|jgi:ribonuclease Z|nr:ribonuclease Z [Candidatus Woesearchaeota archaeon]MBT6336747.1 ribonuclease Z [Candidatus Woesearchaeota archaeon]MBT7928120.1 ribonuclease Z [Candidatus Woesearchaeota archaeon]
MQLTFLGTSAMVPTKERNVTGIYLDYNGEGILIDCGEGTQRQMNIAGINRLKVKKVLITHWHGDHVSGLVGLIQTMGNSDVPQEIKLFGPKGTKEHFSHLLKSCIFNNKVNVIVKEISTKEPIQIFENCDYEIWAVDVKHSAPCIAYSFIEKDKRKVNMAKAEKLGLRSGPLVGRLQTGKSVEFKGKKISPDDVSKMVQGKKLVFILDTWPCKACAQIADGADLLIMESCYATKLDEKADKYKHMTAQQAAQIAHQAKVKRLVLTHFSQRYKTVDEIEQNARDIFPESICAFDFMKIKL